MANTRSAEIRARVSERQRLINKNIVTRARTEEKKVRALIQAGDHEAAKKAYPSMASAYDKASKGSAMHKNTASRVKSRIAHLLAETSSK
ncbi:MAG: 30S ribosomal protein S20 [Verrucomicrobiota bacterium]